MELKIIKDSLTVCKLASTDDIDLSKDFYFMMLLIKLFGALDDKKDYSISVVFYGSYQCGLGRC